MKNTRWLYLREHFSRPINPPRFSKNDIRTLESRVTFNNRELFHRDDEAHDESPVAITSSMTLDHPNPELDEL